MQRTLATTTTQTASRLAVFSLLTVSLLLGNIPRLVHAQEPPAQNEQNEQGEEQNQNADALKGMSFASIAPAEWPETKKVEGYIAELQPNQTIQHGIVTDPTQDNMVYFAATAPSTTTDGTKGTLLSVYRYNTDTQIFERVYRKVYGRGATPGLGEEATPQLNVVGYDNGKIVVLLSDKDYAREQCTQDVLAGTNNAGNAMLMSVDPDDQASGLSPYTAREELLNQARDMEGRCRDEQGQKNEQPTQPEQQPQTQEEQGSEQQPRDT